MAMGSTDVEETTEITTEQPELTKSQSYMSENRFNGEISTPSKIEE